METKALIISLILTLSVALLACQPLDIATALPAPQPTLTLQEPEATAAFTAGPASNPTPLETMPMTNHPAQPVPIEPGLDALIALATEDLARRLGIEQDEIEVLEARAVVWSDASLGCPHPGMAYLQVPEDGVLIRLAAGDQTYNYHGGRGRDPFLCENQFLVEKETPPKLDLDILTPPPGDSGDR